jgi:two-component system sensor histidine kinase AgrC
MAFLFGIEGTALLFLRLLTDSPKHNWIIFLASGAAVFLISQLIKRFFKKHMDINILNNRTMHFLLISAGTALVLIYVNFVIEPPTISLGRWTADFGDITYVLFLVSSAIMFVIIIRYVSRESALRTEMLLTEAFKIYIHDLEKSHNSLRTIKHDYVNILTSLKLYIDGRDMEGLEKYYYEELSELSKDLLSQDRLLGSMKNILLNEIKSILIYKGSVAAQHGIEMGVDAACPVKSLGVSTSIVCQILGILLDNAIEAAEETDEKKLHIAIVIDSRFSTFIIKNSWEKKTIPMNKLFELGFSTKANGRGVGLSTVRSYTEKIKRLYLETELGNDYFTQKLTVEGD